MPEFMWQRGRAEKAERRDSPEVKNAARVLLMHFLEMTKLALAQGPHSHPPPPSDPATVFFWLAEILKP